MSGSPKNWRTITLLVPGPQKLGETGSHGGCAYAKLNKSFKK